MEQQKRWCIFTSAGDHNAIRLWLQGNVPRRWDLIVAYYGDTDHEFAEINKISSNAFRAKGGKFQILKKLMVQNPRCLDVTTTSECRRHRSMRLSRLPHSSSSGLRSRAFYRKKRSFPVRSRLRPRPFIRAGNFYRKNIRRKAFLLGSVHFVRGGSSEHFRSSWVAA